MQRLHHRPEIFFQAGGGRCRDAECVRGRRGIEPEQAGRARGGAHDAQRRRAVPSALVMTRIHQTSQSGLDFETDDVCLEDRTAGRADQFADREDGRHERRARMRE